MDKPKNPPQEIHLDLPEGYALEIAGQDFFPSIGFYELEPENVETGRKVIVEKPEWKDAYNAPTNALVQFFKELLEQFGDEPKVKELMSKHGITYYEEQSNDT